MRRIKLTVAYDGTAYCGWQIQANGETIEGVLDAAIEKLTGEKIHVIGASRTDAGVSALGNVAVFDTDSTIPGDRFAYALNRYIPDDVSVVDSCEVSGDFHPRHCDTRKTYEYRILSSTHPIPQMRHMAWNITHRLDAAKMAQAAQFLVGEHDFKSFACVRTDAETTVRTIYSIEVEERELFAGGKSGDTVRACRAAKNMSGNACDARKAAESTSRNTERSCRDAENMSGDMEDAGKDAWMHRRGGTLSDSRIYTIRVCGNGFLYNMVRIIAGTLVQVGRGQIEPDRVKCMLESCDRTTAGQTAPPQGLTLVRIEYV